MDLHVYTGSIYLLNNLPLIIVNQFSKFFDNGFNIDRNTTYIRDTPIKIISELYLNTGLWEIVVRIYLYFMPFFDFNARI
jgi:hypothetical protein